MDRLAGEMDVTMARMQAADEQANVYGGCGPRLNEEKDASEWLGKEDGPAAKLENEKEQGETIAYDELVKRWTAASNGQARNETRMAGLVPAMRCIRRHRQRHDEASSSPSTRARPRRAPSCSTASRRIVAAAQEEFPQHYPASGWVEHEPGGHLAHDARRPRGARWPRPASDASRRRGDRHHQPARDDARLGPAHRQADPPRHRLAGPPHRRALRAAAGGGRRAAGDARRPGCCSTRISPAPRSPGCSTTSPARAAAPKPGELAFGTVDTLPALAADRRPRARHRRDQRLAHAALRHPRERLGRRAARALRRAALDAAGGARQRRRFRHDRAVALRRRRSPSAASPATSRRRPSARPASGPAW